jgi:hypothetical protein
VKTDREQYRKARRERIAAGKTLAFDLDDAEDVVCPYCGAWQEGDCTTRPAVALRGNELGRMRWAIGRPALERFETVCPSCHQSYGVSVTVRVIFTTWAIERTLTGSRRTGTADRGRPSG